MNYYIAFILTLIAFFLGYICYDIIRNLKDNLYNIDFDEEEQLQDKVVKWATECFGEERITNTDESNHRFLEEALELVQAAGLHKEEAYRLVDYVYNRDPGIIYQEIGGVMLSLMVLGETHQYDVLYCCEREYERVMRKIPEIRIKQAEKPKL